MLGVYSPREPITPEFSREIRAALRRAVTGRPNEKEKEVMRRWRELDKKFGRMKWEGVHFYY
jgi:hypothetical protein